MTTDAQRVRSSWRVAVEQQFRIVGIHHKHQLAIFTGLAVVLALFGTINFNGLGQNVEFPRPSVAYPFLLIMAAFWPVSVWHRHGTSWRGYHWAMPVDRKTQDLARVAMGGAWLLVVIAATLVLAAPFALARHGVELINEQTGWMWLSFFTGPLTIYLFCSLAALRSAFPVAWIVGVSAGMIVMTLTLSSTPLWPALRWIVLGPVGLLTALWSAIVSVVVIQPEVVPPVDAAWLVSVLLWLGLGAASVFLVAGGHREV